jgi:hypothetical protein
MTYVKIENYLRFSLIILIQERMPSFNRIPRMFRLPSHRVFDYKPRFYDPEREKFEILKRSTNESDHESNIRNAFTGKRSPIREHGKEKKYSLRVIFIFIVLSTLFYLFFFA